MGVSSTDSTILYMMGEGVDTDAELLIQRNCKCGEPTLSYAGFLTTWKVGAHNSYVVKGQLNPTQANQTTEGRLHNNPERAHDLSCSNPVNLRTHR